MSLGTDQSIKGVVLAGAHPWERPGAGSEFLRPLVPVGHMPLIGYVVRWLGEGGISRATVCANGSSRFVRSYLGDGSQLGIDLDYYEDLLPRGPAGCAMDAGTATDADVFVVADGTIIPQVDLPRLLRAHAASGAAMTVVVSPGQNGTGPSAKHWVPTGIYILQRRALDHVRKTGYQDTKEVLIPQLHDSGELVVPYQTEEPSPRVTDASTYMAVNQWRVAQLACRSEPPRDYRRIDESHVHCSACMSSEVKLIGPVLVGPRTRIGRDVTIVGPTAIGAECTLEEGAVVCRSVVWDRCNVGRRSMIDRCILTNGASVGGETKLRGVVHAAPRRAAGSVLERLAWWRRPAAGRSRDVLSTEDHDALFGGMGDVDRPQSKMAPPRRRIRREERPGCLPQVNEQARKIVDPAVP